MKVLVLYRNACAHNEVIYSHKIYSEIPDTVLHRKLGISKKGTQYIMGKRDLFSVVIAFRYLLPKDDFITFKRMLTKYIHSYHKKSSCLSEKQLLDIMGFPVNWSNITRYKM